MKSDKTILNYLNQYEKLYGRLLVLGWPLVIVGELGLTREIKIYLEKMISNDEEKEYVFSIISNPLFSSYATIEKNNILKLAIKAKDNINIKNDLAKHTEKYQWTCFDYTGPSHTVETYYNEIHLLLTKDKKELKKELKNTQEYPKKAKIALHNLFKKHKFKKPLLTKINALQDLIYIRDKRKEFLTKAHFLMEKLLDEISSRTKVEKEFLRWLTTEEMTALILNKRFDYKKIKERINYSAVFCNNGKVKIFYKNNAKKYFDLVHINLTTGLNSFKGMSAYHGKIKGAAKLILNVNEGYKLKQGEILVTTMTTVDFVPIIKKSAGIITDEGGITSHAAVIAREFNIPCVIGTHIATQILKDGDLVEVDATKGIVKIKKRAGQQIGQGGMQSTTLLLEQGRPALCRRKGQ